jgi:hypothetical protein
VVGSECFVKALGEVLAKLAPGVSPSSGVYRRLSSRQTIDGGIHRDHLAEDNRRQNRLISDGIRLLRFTAGDILRTPDVVLAQVKTMLRGTSG